MRCLSFVKYWMHVNINAIYKNISSTYNLNVVIFILINNTIYRYKITQKIYLFNIVYYVSIIFYCGSWTFQSSHMMGEMCISHI